MSEWKEKRRKRSNQPSVALKLQLEHLYNNGELRNYTLVDESGLVVSQAGSVEDSNAIAAYVPMFARGDEKVRQELIAELVKTIPNFSPQYLMVREFDLNDNHSVFLAIFGDENGPGEEEMDHAIRGIQRIIRTTSAFEDKS